MDEKPGLLEVTPGSRRLDQVCWRSDLEEEAAPPLLCLRWEAKWDQHRKSPSKTSTCSKATARWPLIQSRDLGGRGGLTFRGSTRG